MSNSVWDILLIDAHLATMHAADGFGIVRDAALGISGENIVWVGERSQLLGEPKNLAREVISLAGCWVTPGLIDCHTHLVYAGSRVQEYVMRLQGKSYTEIAKAGGGIRATVSATRTASAAQLLQESAKRLQAMLACGVTTVEIKSGYGLDSENEIKMLQVAQQLSEQYAVTVQKTFLGAHSVAPEFAGDHAAYIDYVCHRMLPEVAALHLVDAVDVFCENIAFTLAQAEQVFQTAQRFNLPVKIHAEQLSDQGGAKLAAQYVALSADHLEYLSKAGVQALADAGTVAVLLPAAFYFLHETKLPPIKELRQQNVAMALATDCNPGSAPCTSLLLVMSLACQLFGMTPVEALLGVTRYAARALGLENKIGSLAVGKRADLAIWDINEPAELSYYLGYNPCKGRIWRGKKVD